jgi:xanthine dehydrogenase accessory factor
MRDWLEQIAALRGAGERFATATVVGRRAPVSAHLGDRAIVRADGCMVGFIGGACSREIVRKQALDAMRTGRARLVSIRPDAAQAGQSDSEHVFVAMTCVSEGAVDVYVEPDVRPRRLVVVGATPVADAVARTAAALEYDVVRVVDANELGDVEPVARAAGCRIVPLDALASVVHEGGTDSAAVVASQGHYDEQALEGILRHGATYVGLVASRTRGAAVKAWLNERGVPGVESIRNPAGLDLGARTAPDVAVSILAEVLQLSSARPLEQPVAATPAPSAGVSATAVDPVCRMEVVIATARHSAEVGGTRYYFCCAACQRAFTANPASYQTAAHD